MRQAGRWLRVWWRDGTRSVPTTQEAEGKCGAADAPIGRLDDDACGGAGGSGHGSAVTSEPKMDEDAVGVQGALTEGASRRGIS